MMFLSLPLRIFLRCIPLLSSGPRSHRCHERSAVKDKAHHQGKPTLAPRISVSCTCKAHDLKQRPQNEGFSCRVLQKPSSNACYELVDETEVVEKGSRKQGSSFVFDKKIVMDYFCETSSCCLPTLTSAVEKKQHLRLEILDTCQGTGEAMAQAMLTLGSVGPDS
eukprot:756776-Hanusia_phi.AAC.1